MFLFFDLNKPFLKGRLSCYINKNDDEKPKYRVSDKDIDGYEHLGRLVVTMKIMRYKQWSVKEEKYMSK